MIVTFHLVSKLFQHFLMTRQTFQEKFILTSLNSISHPLAEPDLERGIKFDPPVFKQRYERAVHVLLEEKWKNQIQKLVDFGCAELGFFIFLKSVVPVREMFFVDADEQLLRDYYFKVYPLNADHLVPRTHPLTVKVLAGSISNPDSCLENTDAVTALEIIEHLYPDVLDALPYNLFSYVHPKLVIITTPNSEFNVYFTNLKKFRHSDHKFEWTRDQFVSWATNITQRFPAYTVQFDGIGLDLKGSDDFGCCSQMAVFIRKDLIYDDYTYQSESSLKYSYGVCTHLSCSKAKAPKNFEEIEDNYKVICTVEYPFFVDERTEEEKLLDEVKYRIHLFESMSAEHYDWETETIAIPLTRLCSHKTPDLPGIKSLLVKFNYKIEECLNQETNQLESCVICKPEMESGSSNSDAEASGQESDKHNTEDPHLSDWDESRDSWGNSPSKDGKRSNVKAQLHLELTDRKKSNTRDSKPAESSSEPSKSAIPFNFKNVNDKLNEKPNRLSNILSVFDNFDKINELDAARKEKKYFNFATNLPPREVMKKLCQEIVNKHPVAGPSRDFKKTKPKKINELDESTEEIKSITTCILENSLNTIETRESENQPTYLIRDLLLESDRQNEQTVEIDNLINNSTALESNHNLQEVKVLQNISIHNTELLNTDIDLVDVLGELTQMVENQEENPPEMEFDWSSREALYDVNSQVDLLDDFDLDTSGAVVSAFNLPEPCFAVVDNNIPDEAVLPDEDSNFPNWLLQIFEEGEVGVPDEELHDEPHFYCQGDGLGVHPSTLNLDDDADDDGNESDESDSTSSSSGSIDFANAEGSEDQLVVVGQLLSNDNGNNPQVEQENAEGEESDASLATASPCTEQ